MEFSQKLTEKWKPVLDHEDLPKIEEYGGLDLIENGVGQIRSFLDNFNQEKKIVIKI